jgi:predicted naringenin-chalcone synthase
MSFTIRGLGTVVPPAKISCEEGMRVAQALQHCTAEQSTWLEQVYRHSGIQNRHLVWGEQAARDVLDGTSYSNSACLPKNIPDDPGPTMRQRMLEYETHAGPLACEAARLALATSGFVAADITHLVTVTCTGFYAPGFDYALIEGLKLDRGTQRIQVGFMGCHGALNGMRTARALTGAEPDARVLLCAVELCSLHYYYRWNAQKLIANALFADGAAALVGTSRGEAGDWRLAASGSYLFPDSADAMTWTLGDHGFEMTLSRHVPNLIQKNLRPWMTGWLKQHGLTLEQVGSWAIHPGGPKVLSAAIESLDVKPQQVAASHEVLADFGNMSSTTLLFIVQRLQQRRAPLPCVALGFGPGLTAEAALFV